MAHEERPDWLKPDFNMSVTVNLQDTEFDLGAADNTLAELLGAIGELIERNLEATSFVFTVVRKTKTV